MVVTVSADARNSMPQMALFAIGLEPVATRWLTPEGDLSDPGWQGEDHMEKLDGQKVLGTRRHPVARRRLLTLWAMPVLAGIVGDVMVAAFGAARYMPAERLGPAGFDRPLS